jgi:hypothetical protein
LLSVFATLINTLIENRAIVPQTQLISFKRALIHKILNENKVAITKATNKGIFSFGEPNPLIQLAIDPFHEPPA